MKSLKTRENKGIQSDRSTGLRPPKMFPEDRPTWVFWRAQKMREVITLQVGQCGNQSIYFAILFHLNFDIFSRKRVLEATLL